MTLDYNQRTVDALSKALGMTPEQVGRILTDYEAMRPDIPLGLSDTGWYISQDHKWFFHHCADGSCQIVAASPCPNTPPSLRRRGLNVPHVHRLWGARMPDRQPTQAQVLAAAQAGVEAAGPLAPGRDYGMDPGHLARVRLMLEAALNGTEEAW